MPDRRGSPDAGLAVDIDHSPDCPPLRARVIKAGRAGLLIETQLPLPEGLPVRLRVPLAGQAEAATLTAAVAWVDPELGMAIRFTRLEPGDAAVIDRIMAAQASAGDCRQEPPALQPATRANGTSVLYLGLPSGAIKASVRGALAAAGMPVAEPHQDILAVPLAPGTLIRLSTDFRRLLTEEELDPCKALVLAEGIEPNLADLMRTQSLRTLVADVEGEWLLTMIRDERLISYFQPIVHASAPGTAFGYEALLRGIEHDGTVVPPRRLFDAARSPGLLFHLDRLGRLTAIRGAVAHRLATRLFINFNPAAIDDPASHLRSTIDAIAESGMSPERIVFEVVESEKIKDVKHLLTVLDFYRGAGFGVALDDLGAGYSSLNLLTQLRPDFVKLDMEMVRNVDADPYRAEIVTKFLELARNLGIRTVAEGVETEGEWRWFRAHDVDYLQGFLFARPGLPPPVPKPPAT